MCFSTIKKWFQGDNVDRRIDDNDYYKKILKTYVDVMIVTDKKDKEDNIEATRHNLSNEAARLSDLIAEQSNSKPVTDDCKKWLTEARESISKSSLDHELILSKMDLIKNRLLRAYESRKIQPKWFLGLGIYNVLLLIAAGALIWRQMLIPSQENLQEIGFVIFACAVWGGVGGIVDALYALHIHFSHQDFDKRFRPWYILHPVLGVSLGAIIFVLIQAGLMAVTDTQLKETPTHSEEPANQVMVDEHVAVREIALDQISYQLQNDEETTNESDDTSEGVPAGGTSLPIALAFLAGFKQRAAIDFISRVVKSVFQSENTE